MGIEARCPNGHEVRVKDRFAGQRVYCPECAAKFRVPMPGAAATPPTAAVVSLDAAYAATLPRATPAGARRTAEPGRKDRQSGREDREPGREDREPGREDRQQRADKPGRDTRERSRHRRSAPPDAAPAATPPPAPAPGRLHPVIAEAVDLTWNVALPGGDPSEPLTAETLQEWLDGGGATGKELVWRADWPDWVPIRLVFPEHVPRAAG